LGEGGTCRDFCTLPFQSPIGLATGSGATVRVGCTFVMSRQHVRPQMKRLLCSDTSRREINLETPPANLGGAGRMSMADSEHESGSESHQAEIGSLPPHRPTTPERRCRAEVHRQSHDARRNPHIPTVRHQPGPHPTTLKLIKHGLTDGSGCSWSVDVWPDSGTVSEADACGLTQCLRVWFVAWESDSRRIRFANIVATQAARPRTSACAERGDREVDPPRGQSSSWRGSKMILWHSRRTVATVY
jgi:hypothetical protein